MLFQSVYAHTSSCRLSAPAVGGPDCSDEAQGDLEVECPTLHQEDDYAERLLTLDQGA